MKLAILLCGSLALFLAGCREAGTVLPEEREALISLDISSGETGSLPAVTLQVPPGESAAPLALSLLSHDGTARPIALQNIRYRGTGLTVNGRKYEDHPLILSAEAAGEDIRIKVFHSSGYYSYYALRIDFNGRLAAPGGLAAQQQERIKLRLDWDPVPQAEGYVLYRSHNGSEEEVYRGPDNAFLDENLRYDRSYAYSVEAYNAVSRSDRSAELSAATGLPERENVMLQGGLAFDMIRCPAGTTPLGLDDLGSAELVPFWIAETELSYEIWYEVRSWGGGAPGYSINYAGTPGDSFPSGVAPIPANASLPVSSITWNDAVVFCNALTAYYNALIRPAQPLSFVYFTDVGLSTVYNDSFGPIAVYADPDATGFRLLGAEEWEAAARFINGTIWNRGGHVSGDEEGPAGVSPHWIDYVSILGGNIADIATALPNALGLYDMSGNVKEWCFEADPSNPSKQMIRGGDVQGGTGLKLAEFGYVGTMIQQNRGGIRLGRSAAP